MTPIFDPNFYEERLTMGEIGFYGYWRIKEMEMWDQEFIDAEVPGYFSFGDNSEFKAIRKEDKKIARHLSGPGESL